MIDSISNLLRDVINFLGGLNVIDFIFLGLFLIIYVWMLFTHKKVKRVISDPLGKYDRDIKKKQDELDQEKKAIRAFANKEIKKVEEFRAEQKAQFEKEIEALKGKIIEKEGELKAEAEAMARAQKEMEAEKAVKVKEIEEEVKAEKEFRIEPMVHVEEAQEAVKEIPAEEEVREEPALEPEPEEESEKDSKKPAKKEKTSKLTTEQYFILSAIADEPDKTYQEEAMYKIFKMAFSDREKEDFDQDVKKLEKLNYIILEKPSGYRIWLKITDKGLAHYRNTEGS
jgi:hypothetical protein